MSNDFSHQKEEYLSLRKEVENAISELSTLDRNCLVAISLVYSWLISQRTISDLDKKIGWGVPILLACFSALRSYSINRHLGIIGSYLKHVEELNKPGGDLEIGWETFFGKKGRGIQGKSRTFFWVALILFTVVLWLVRVW